MIFGLSGGVRKFSDVNYGDGSEVPKRSRQLVWRAAVERSKTASQLAFQVCHCLYYVISFILYSSSSICFSIVTLV